MGLVIEHDGTAEGYEAVPLAIGGAGIQGGGAAVLRRRSARPSRWAVMYVHCLGDPFVPADLVGWYTERGFHFYAADLRDVGATGPGGPDGNRAAGDLRECFACLDAAMDHLRGTDAIDTVVVCAHGTGALIAALWCHARRGSGPADAVVLASPALGRSSWLARPGVPPAVATTDRHPVRRASPLLAAAQRRIRRGLDIPAPVLVMCPDEGWDVPGGTGGLLGLRAIVGKQVVMRLGEHVTWLKLDEGLPGQARPTPAGRKRFYDELGRWLSAYLSGQIRDQLL
jgi:hypothetical protein